MALELPPLNLSFAQNATSGLSQNGASWGFAGNNGWTVNMDGAGYGTQGASSSTNWLLIAAALALVYFLKK